MLDATNSGQDSHSFGHSESKESDKFLLSEILPSARFFAADEIAFSSIATSSSTAQPGELVVYRIGEMCPETVISDAMARGAAGILTEQLLPTPVPQCIVGDIELAMAPILCQMHRRPDRNLLTVGVLGSAGKTTTTLLLSSLLRSRGVRTAFQTDLGDCDGVIQNTSRETQPSGADLIQWMSDVCDSNCEAGVIELDNQTLRRGGYDAIQFDVLIVTGADAPRDDFGPSALECAIDRLTTSGAVIVPADDAKTVRVVRDSGVSMVTYGVRNAADVTAKIIEQAGGVTTLMVSHQDTTVAMETTLCGAAMAANHAAVVMAGLLLNVPLHEAVEALSQLREIPGRGQWLPAYDQATAIVDIGGDTNRAAAALRSARGMAAGAQLWCVLAIDPNECPERLAQYGGLLERFANQPIVCSTDDRRGFLKASHALLDGVEHCASIRLVSNRQRAIAWAVSHAKPQDIILVMGQAATTNAHQQRSLIDDTVKCIERERDNSAEGACPERESTSESTLRIFKPN